MDRTKVQHKLQLKHISEETDLIVNGETNYVTLSANIDNQNTDTFIQM